MLRHIPCITKCERSAPRTVTSIRPDLPRRQKNIKNNKLHQHRPNGWDAKRKENGNLLKEHVPAPKLIRNVVRRSTIKLQPQSEIIPKRTDHYSILDVMQTRIHPQHLEIREETSNCGYNFMRVFFNMLIFHIFVWNIVKVKFIRTNNK